MAKNKLTKVEALKLISPVVDNEVSVAQRQAFMNFIEEHDDVRRKYESLKRLKTEIRTRCPYEKAPDSLRKYIKTVSEQGDATSPLEDAKPPIYDIPSEGPGGHQTSPQTDSNLRPANKWVFSIAASLLLVVGVWGFFNFYDAAIGAQKVYNIEEYAYEHFMNHKGQFVQPTIATASMGSAEIQLASNYDMPMTIPSLKKAEFKGVVYNDFVPNFKSPMLEYYISSEDQYIYIFAFKLDKMEKFGQLERGQEAVKTCNKPKDFHIRNINGKHVVSWKWDDVWYAAISNHNGNTLASLVEPLQYNPSEQQ